MKLKFIKLLLVITITNTFLLTSFNTFAADKNIEIPLSQEYEKCVFNLSFENPGKYSIAIISPSGREYIGEMIDEKSGKCSIQSADAGTWAVRIEANSDEDIGKVTVNVKSISDISSELTDSSEIKVAKDITGLKTYLKDDSVVVSWTDEKCGDVNVSVIDTNSQEIIGSEKVHGTSYEVKIPKDTNEITVSVVPAISYNIAEAEQKYTMSTNNSKKAEVIFSDSTITNQNNSEINIKADDNYQYIIYNNDKLITSTDISQAGEYDFDVGLDEDRNSILLFIVDENGNMKSYTCEITKDTTPPLLTLTGKYEDYSTYDNSITVEGNVEEYTSFEINGHTYEIAENGNFSIDYMLKSGSNKIDVKAFDKAGNSTEYSYKVEKLIQKKIDISRLAILIGIIFGIVLFIVIVVKRFIYLKKCNSDKKESAVEDENTKNKIKIKNIYFSNKIKGNENQSKRVKSFLNCLVWIVFCIILFKVIFPLGNIPTDSMAPTISKGSQFISNGIIYWATEPQRGDVVAFRNKEFNEYMCKRIIGVGGDTITFSNGDLYINGLKCEENYLDADIETNPSEINTDFTVPEGSYFLLGDNRDTSLDSRYWSDPYIKKSDIIGKIILAVHLPIFS